MNDSEVQAYLKLAERIKENDSYFFLFENGKGNTSQKIQRRPTIIPAILAEVEDSERNVNTMRMKPKIKRIERPSDGTELSARICLSLKFNFLADRKRLCVHLVRVQNLVRERFLDRLLLVERVIV